jgi:hypothetical protein
MSNIIVGRSHEKEILDELLLSPKAELLAIYGRRRVGKTYLVRSYLEKYITFSCSGQIDGTMESQIKNFYLQLKKYFPAKKNIKQPETWHEAFTLLQACLNNVSH